jgi:hypothetical protein
MEKSFHIVFCSNSESSVKKTIEFLEEKKYYVTFAKSEGELLSILKEIF